MTPEELREDLKKISEETLQIGNAEVAKIVRLFGGYERMAKACLLPKVTAQTVRTWGRSGIPTAKSIRVSIKAAAKKNLDEEDAYTVIDILDRI